MKTHEEQTYEALARAIEAIKSASHSDAAAQLEHGLVLGVATRHVIAYALGRGASRRDAYLFARDTLTACADEMARLAAELAPEGRCGVNLTAEREAHLRYLAGIDDAMRDAMGMLDRARSERDMERITSGVWQSIATLAATVLNARANVHAEAQTVTRGGEVDGIEPRAAADAPQRHDAGSGLEDLAAGRADVGDGVGGEGGHGHDGSTIAEALALYAAVRGARDFEEGMLVRRIGSPHITGVIDSVRDGEVRVSWDSGGAALFGTMPSTSPSDRFIERRPSDDKEDGDVL